MPTPDKPQPRSAAGRHGVRVASDATRSILSARSVESATSAGASASVPLARRILNPPSTPGAPLPPIIPPLTTSTANPSNDIPRLNDEIYDLIALALRGYVSSWYQRLSPRDKEFVPEVSKAIVAVLQAVDERIRTADLDCLLLHDFPILVSQHYRDYRLARSKVHTAYASGGSQDSDPHVALVHIFHNIQSHLAVGPNGEIDDTYLRQAVDHVLKTCLPPQDWSSEMERSIVREIIVKPILGSVLPKLAEPWFLHSIALALLGSPRPLEPPTPPPPKEPNVSQFKPQHLIIAFLTLVQVISTFCLNAIAFIQRSRGLINTINSQSSSRYLAPEEERDYAAPLLDLASTFFSMDTRGASSSILSILETVSGFSTPFLDKLLKYFVSTNLLTPSRVSSLILLSKTILFPDGYPGPPPIVPSLPEQAVLREQLERRIRECIPDLLAPYVLGPTVSAKRETIREALEPLSSPACNVHLVMLLFDAVVLTLFPEMGIETVSPDVGLGSAEDGSGEGGIDAADDEDSRSAVPGSDDESAAQQPDNVALVAL